MRDFGICNIRKGRGSGVAGVQRWIYALLGRVWGGQNQPLVNCNSKTQFSVSCISVTFWLRLTGVLRCAAAISIRTTRFTPPVEEVL